MPIGKKVVKIPEMFEALERVHERKISQVARETGIPVWTIYNYKNKGIGLHALTLLKVVKNIARSDAEFLKYINMLLDYRREIDYIQPNDRDDDW